MVALFKREKAEDKVLATEASKFAFEGINIQTDKAERGQVTALDETDARSQLRQRGIVVESLRPTTGMGRFLQTDFNLGGGGISTKELAVFARNLAVTEASGLSTFRAIGMIAKQQKEGSKLGLVLRDIHRRMANGQDIKEAFEAHEDTFGPLAVALIGAGLQAGRLEVTLLKMADMLERQTKLKSKVRSAMTYPAAIAFFATLAMVGALVFVIPTFEDTYKEFGGDLPTLTQWLLAVSGVLQRFWFLLPGIPFLAFFGMKRVRRHPVHGITFDSMLLKFPIFGPILWDSVSARTADILSVMLEAQVPSVRALALARDAAGNKAVMAALDRSIERHKAGDAMSVSLEDEPAIPEILPALMAQGEETLNPEELLSRYAKMTEASVESKVTALTDLLQPFVLIFLALLIGIIAVGVYLPIVSLYDFFS